jgi:hypothetical protein
VSRSNLVDERQDCSYFFLGYLKPVHRALLSFGDYPFGARIRLCSGFVVFLLLSSYSFSSGSQYILEEGLSTSPKGRIFNEPKDVFLLLSRRFLTKQAV